MPVERDSRPSHSPGQICALCGTRSRLISRTLKVCGGCIRTQPSQALRLTGSVHCETRRAFDLPLAPPQEPGGVLCALCTRQCRIGEGERGFCGLRTAHNGRLVHRAGTPERGLLRWYRDPLPTNCVADWVCRGSQQFGRHNLAVFYASCTLNCLFCQNWHFREASPARGPLLSAAELAEAANEETYCVCFFGGDPASQMPHALAAAERLARQGVVICWETSGTSHAKLVDRAVRLSLQTGGCIKFDLKAHNEALHITLTGATNQRTLDNFARAAARYGERPEPALVVASTLLVPGYVDAAEVGRIAQFIAALDPRIPYALLAFAPRFCMVDLPRTSLRHAQAAEAAARAAGLANVRIGNRYLLSDDY